MNSPRWKKILRDLQAARGRMTMMVIAIAVSIFGVATVLSAYTILTREVARNYLGTNPASALLTLNQLDEPLVNAVRQRPDIAYAEASSLVLSRAEVNGKWMPILLFVVPDFNAMRVNKFTLLNGAQTPADGNILLEREALKLIKANIGDSFYVQTPHGEKQSVSISGTVHDPGLAPAWQEQALYGYITPSTLATLGEGSTLHILKIVVKNQPYNTAAIDSTVGDLSAWLKSQGYSVGEVRIPPPGKHPHQGQMNAVLTLLLVFSVMALILSAILTATMIGGLLAQQIQQIGIMKAIGARSRQITGLYLALVAIVGAAATALGVPLGIVAGRSFTGVVAQLLNLNIYNNAVPAWVYLVLISMGILTPLLVALDPILKTTRITVRETLSDYGISRDASASFLRDSWFSRIRLFDNTLRLSLRNTFRRRGRLILTLSLLSAAGAMFMTGINVKSGWQQYLSNAAADRHYDLEVRLYDSQPEEKVFSIIKGLPTVQKVETWNYTPAAIYRPDGLDIVRTYPDGGHGSFMLRSVSVDTNLIDKPLLSGRWLQADDTNGVVLNQLAKAFFPNANIGDEIQLTVNGQAATFRLVGVLRQVLTPAAAYVTPSTYATATGISLQSIDGVRVVFDRHDAATIDAATNQIQNALTAQNVSLRVLLPEDSLGEALSGHVFIFIFALLLISTVMAIVGGLGLMSSMGTSVIERTREFGVMRAIGAKSNIILRNVISEGLFIGLMSWVIALPLSIPLSLGIGYLVGNLSFRSPLPLVISPTGLVIWFLVLVIGSIAASAYPAQQASRLTVRETLAYV